MDESKKILIVEDQSIVARDILNKLIKLGYHVPAIVSTGRDAIEKSGELLPDLILMDITLQGAMDGIEAAGLIKQKYRIPVVYLTAYADEETFERAKMTDPHGYIVKPFDEIELRVSIEMALYKCEMEKKLRQSEQWFETTLNSIGDAVIATDKKGFVTFLNPTAEELIGWNIEEAVSKQLHEIFNVVDENDNAIVQNPVEQVINGEPMIDTEGSAILIAKNGFKKHITESAAPIFDRDKNIIGVVLVFRDITEKKLVEEELLKSQKLQSIGVLAGGIAHDLNNHLTPIMGNITMANRLLEKNEPGKVPNMLKRAEKAAEQAHNLTQQLLTFSKGGDPVISTLSVSRLLKEAMDFAMHGSKSRCELSISASDPSIDVDPGQVCQVIQNIIINADQAMPLGGVISVSILEEHITKKHGLPLGDREYVVIEIKDTGIGIHPQHIKKIFDPYFSTKNKGNGLGLATAYSIIQKHNGWITVDSQLGDGTTFTIYLPKSVEITKENSILSVPDKVFSGKILLMDDEDFIREATGLMLNELGYSVDFAINGTEALSLFEKANEKHDSYAAAILDLTVPGDLGGREVIGRLRKIDPVTKVIVSSGYSNDPVLAKFREFGFNGRIKKPYKFNDLSDALHECLAEA